MSSEKSISLGLILILILASFSLTTFHAEASEEEYHLILTSTEGGNIVQPEDDEDGPVYKEYSEGDSVVIEAESDDNYEFVEWTGDTEYIDNVESKNTNIEMNANHTVTAEFEKETRELSIDVDGEGEVTKPGQGDFSYEHGEEVNLRADPDEDYVFEKWSGDTGEIEDTEDELTTITMEDDYDITAEFEEDHYELSIDVDGEGEILQPDGEGDHEIEREKEIVLEAKADQHYDFKRWTGDIETIKRPRSNITTITMEDDYDITAEFEKETYELSIDIDGEGEVIRPGEGDFEYEYDETVVIEAEADEKHRFEAWTGDIENIENYDSDLTTITMEDDYDITAEFEEDYYELSIDVDGEGEVIRPGEGDFEFERDEEIVIEAEAFENYEFVEWTGDTEGIENSTSKLTTIIMEDDYDITAEFEKEMHELSIDIDGEGEVIRPEEETSSHEYGDEIILEVEPDEGYDFSGWTGDTDKIDDPDAELSSIEMTDDHDITAEFESENIELEIEWIIIAILAIALIGMVIKTKRSSEGESEKKERPKEGICENCGEIVPIESKECPECGAPLAPPDIPELQKAKS